MPFRPHLTSGPQSTLKSTTPHLTLTWNRTEADWAAHVRYLMRQGLPGRIVVLTGLLLLVLAMAYPLLGWIAVPVWLTLSGGLLALVILSIFRAPQVAARRLQHLAPLGIASIDVADGRLALDLNGWRTERSVHSLARVEERAGYLWLHSTAGNVVGIPRRACEDPQQWLDLSQALLHPGSQHLAAVDKPSDLGEDVIRYHLTAADWIDFQRAVHRSPTPTALPVFLRYRLWRNPRLLPDGEILLRLDDEGLIQRIGGVCNRISWQSISAVYDHPRVIVLMRDPWLGLAIPKRAVPNKEYIMARATQVEQQRRYSPGSGEPTDPFAPPQFP